MASFDVNNQMTDDATEMASLAARNVLEGRILEQGLVRE